MDSNLFERATVNGQLIKEKVLKGDKYDLIFIISN